MSEFEQYQRLVVKCAAGIIVTGIALLALLSLSACAKPPPVYKISVELEDIHNHQKVDFYAQSYKQYYSPGDPFFYQVVWYEGRGCIYWGDVGDYEGIVTNVELTPYPSERTIELPPGTEMSLPEPGEGMARENENGMELYTAGEWRKVNVHRDSL